MAKQLQLYELHDLSSVMPAERDRFFAAHTVEEKSMMSFTKDLALALGRRGLVRTPNSLHATVSNGAMRGMLKNIGYTEGNVIDFAVRLRCMLRNSFGTAPDRLGINKEKPLVWVGVQRRKLALSLADDRLDDQRGAIDEFFRQYTGITLKARFLPHVSLTSNLNGIAKERASAFVDKFTAAKLPEAIATKGLEVYFRSVHRKNFVWGLRYTC